MKYLAILLFFICSGCAANKKIEHECTHAPHTFRCVKFIKNYDGDTATFDIEGVPDIIGKNISVRVRGVDAPEIKGKSACEKSKAQIAKHRVNSVLKIAKKIDLENVSRGKYFRLVAEIIADGKSLKEILMEEKLAYPYHGKTKKKIDWCRPL